NSRRCSREEPPKKRSLIAVFIYLVIAAGVGAGFYTNDPYKGNSIAVSEAAGVLGSRHTCPGSPG
ncbi:MAG: hypothetical protein V3R81_14310, partial [Gammaproteobacteria bacterium]